MRIAIHNASFSALGGGERVAATLAAHLAKDHDVTLISITNMQRAEVQAVFGIDLSAVKSLADHKWGSRRRHFDGFDVFINNSHEAQLVNHAPFGILICMFPLGRSKALASYNVIAANSAFTSQWIAQRWGCQAEIVHPPCPDLGPPARKQNTIVNVGRFVAEKSGAGRKNQMTMLQAFRKLVDGGLKDWHLHLIGTPGHRAADADFIATLRAEAQNYPVRIETRLGLHEMREHLRRASLYWHAMGYGPMNEGVAFHQEHFGMSVVEAMSAGVVPLAFKSGGPTEVIQHGTDGYLWSNLTELEDFTLKLIGKPDEMAQMREQAVRRAQDFNTAAYLAKMDDIIARAATASPRRKPSLGQVFRRWLPV